MQIRSASIPHASHLEVRPSRSHVSQTWSVSLALVVTCRHRSVGRLPLNSSTGWVQGSCRASSASQLTVPLNSSKQSRVVFQLRRCCTPPPALASAAAYLLAAQRRSAPRVYTKASKSMLPYERSLQASKILVPFERARTGISLGTRVSTTNVAVRDKPTALHNGFFTSVHQAVALRDGGNVGSAKPLQTVAIEPPHPLSSAWAAIRPNSGVGVRPSTTGVSRPFTPTAPVPYRLQLALPGARTAAATAASQGRVQPPPL